jgi:hypothetical protein
METQTTEFQSGSENENNVNLDLLIMPDGSAEAGDLSMLSNLPNLDPKTEDIADFQTQTNTQTSGEQKNDYFSQKYLERIKKEYEQHGVAMPEDINEENFIDNFSKLYSSKDKASNLHPEVEKFQKAMEAGIDPNEFYRTMKGFQEVEDMDSYDLVRNSLTSNFGKSDRRPNGWDDDKIESTIKKMDQSGLLDVEAERIKTDYQDKKLLAADQMIEQQNSLREKQGFEMDKQRDSSIKNAVSYFNKLENINGLPISQSEKSEFVEQFKYLVTPNEKKGMSPLLEMLQSDETLVKVAYFLSKGDAKIREQLTRSKEYAKNDFLRKLDPEPKLAQGRGGFPSSDVDLDALAAPSNY